MLNTKNYINDFRIVIASLPNRENCVCEIYYKHVQWAEISQENTEAVVQFYSHPTEKYWEFPIDIAIEILQKAKSIFAGDQ